MQDHSLACLGTSPPEWFFIQNGSLRMQPHATQLQLRDRSQELAHFPTTLGLARGLLVTNRESLQGEPCGGSGAGRGHCAPGMECVKSRKRRKGKAGAAAGGPEVSGVCVCKSRYPVCGSNGITYSSGCQLRAASLKAESRGEKAITQVSKGTCEQGPSIVTPPKDIWNVTGAQVYLSCEVIGIPTPVLIWNKVKRGHYGVQRTELLPGDRDNLAIQTRGGPEKHEVTGWVLVSPLSKEDAGEYECHASNSQGQASASAKITVVDALHEIPVKKGEGAEL
ncbi:insulin-like growth factor-binding protein 7 [Neophocaena asiaeorientalis asiaeorientalis]|uniref:Insulin-like growth factor-binding protein 7 n=1 Tax=Neophocaena asiaeorientalis asiaeorientalis TaxID=1706337 RepID=A0A341BL39_NEOAA|nr:insulin-like growth factor-binding protein 7 [Neophocaena asiaeorientalis asiaeorientalis]